MSIDAVKALLQTMFRLSSARGRDASGLLVSFNENTWVYKDNVEPKKLVSSALYSQLFKTIEPLLHENKPLLLMGHSRMATNGRQFDYVNNQPVIRKNLIGVHNGIITNEEALWALLKDEKKQFSVDTEVWLAMVASAKEQGLSPIQAIEQTLPRIQGTLASAVFFPEDAELILTTNYGSLHAAFLPEEVSLFASEKFILDEIIKKYQQRPLILHSSFNFSTQSCKPFESISIKLPFASKAPLIHDLAKRQTPLFANINRCKKCILPDTFPFLDLDKDGICHYCRTHVSIDPLGIPLLQEKLSHYRGQQGEPDCLVAISGGRDSCYGLHVLKTELKMNPVAFTYDWGMVTDLARRNIARLCGKLGVEHILVSADISKKLSHIRKNVCAWMKKPDLGMVPLFMAGDKQFYYYAERAMKRLGINLIIYCENGRLERAHFKSGFCGINEGLRRTYNIQWFEKIKLCHYYLKNFLKNPRYFNSSLFDSLFAFYSSYLINHDYLFLFDYYLWEEKTVIDTLIKEYGWEIAKDTPSTWRIGDGTAAFYNYIYYTIAGFSEHDTFRSKQIRYGLITREEALAFSNIENQPRWEAMEWYASQVGFNLNEALRAIHAMPKLYSYPERGLLS